MRDEGERATWGGGSGRGVVSGGTRRVAEDPYSLSFLSSLRRQLEVLRCLECMLLVEADACLDGLFHGFIVGQFLVACGQGQAVKVSAIIVASRASGLERGVRPLRKERDQPACQGPIRACRKRLARPQSSVDHVALLDASAAGQSAARSREQNWKECRRVDE